MNATSTNINQVMAATWITYNASMADSESESKKGEIVTGEVQYHSRSEEEAATKIQAAFKGMKARNKITQIKEQKADDLTIMNIMTREATVHGVSDLWKHVNHIAIVVKDVGRSLAFYTHVVGMTQIMRPNFDRHGAWLSMGTVDLHLIKGRPAVHENTDLIVGHIAITIDPAEMENLRERLRKMGIQFRKNVSVPNPSRDKGKRVKPVDQAFVRDPDGYYIEFCGCAGLEEFLQDKMNEAEGRVKTFQSILHSASVGEKLSLKSEMAKLNISKDVYKMRSEMVADLKTPSWMIPDDHIKKQLSKIKTAVNVDEEKLANLVKRRETYGDITQNATETQLRYLMILHENQVPQVIKSLKDWVNTKGTQIHIPPAFYDRSGNLFQPPSFEMPILTKR